MQRGVAGTDYNYHSEVDGLCWYRMPNFRRLYPEYHDLTDNDLAEQLYAEAGRPPKHFYPWQKVASTIAIAIEAPLVVLGLGLGLLWAASDSIARLEAYLGFRAWLRSH